MSSGFLNKAPPHLWNRTTDQQQNSCVYWPQSSFLICPSSSWRATVLVREHWTILTTTPSTSISDLRVYVGIFIYEVYQTKSWIKDFAESADLTVRVSLSWAACSITRVEDVGSRPELTPTNSSSSSHSSCRRARGSSWRTAALRARCQTEESVCR